MNPSSRWRLQKQRRQRGVKADGNNKSAADGDTQQPNLSGDGNGGSNCDGEVDGNVDGYIDDDGGGKKRK